MRRALVIDHPPPTLPDRASAHLAASGWQVCRACPALGDGLPDAAGFDAVILLGGRAVIGDEANHPYLRDEYRLVDSQLRDGRPMLGLGLGAQVIAHVMGAEIGPRHRGEVEMGWFPVRATAAGAHILAPEMHVFQWHSHGFGLPFGATRLAASPLFPNQAALFAPGVYGFQFRADLPLAGQEELLATIGAEAWTEGAETAEESRSAGAAHDAGFAWWFCGFLDQWIAEAGLAPLRLVASKG